MAWTNTPWIQASEARAKAADTAPCSVRRVGSEELHAWRVYRLGGPSGVPLFTICDDCGRTPIEILDRDLAAAEASRKAAAKAETAAKEPAKAGAGA